jgi:hypothetical protein
MPDRGPEEFVGEAMTPVGGTGDAAAMGRGEPGLPGRFRWRGREYRIAGLIRKWKSSGPCRSGGGEVYLRRHWYKVLTEPPGVMTIYCDRQAKDRKRPKARWWVYTVEPGRFDSKDP